MVALFNLYVFKCLRGVHVNFMNPSVFVTQPSAKGKINFSSVRERETPSYGPCLVGRAVTVRAAASSVSPRSKNVCAEDELGSQFQRVSICLHDLFLDPPLGGFATLM